MKIQRYKLVILSIFLASALIVASPALQQLTLFPQTQYLTELSLLGKNHEAVYPSNITEGENYRLYLDVTNHLGSCAYYVVEMKFRNLTQSGPDSFNHTHSDLPSLGSLTVFAADEAQVELPIDVSFQYNVNERNSSILDMQAISLNGAVLDVNATSIAKDPITRGFYGNLFFELWLYNDTANAFTYNERYVSLWLKFNTTAT